MTDEKQLLFQILRLDPVLIYAFWALTVLITLALIVYTWSKSK